MGRFDVIDEPRMTVKLAVLRVLEAETLDEGCEVILENGTCLE